MRSRLIKGYKRHPLADTRHNCDVSVSSLISLFLPDEISRFDSETSPPESPPSQSLHRLLRPDLPPQRLLRWQIQESGRQILQCQVPSLPNSSSIEIPLFDSVNRLKFGSLMLFLTFEYEIKSISLFFCLLGRYVTGRYLPLLILFWKH